MKLNVSGIESIEITDPNGLCNQPVPAITPSPNPSIPLTPWPTGMPQPAGMPQPVHLWTTPYTGEPIPQHTKIWSKTLPRTAVTHNDPDYHEKWGAWNFKGTDDRTPEVG